MTPVDHALHYAARGWRIVPIEPGLKHPAIDQWQHKATTDPDRIRRYWGHPTRADHGIGIATGHESGIFVVDIDPGDGGDDSLAALEAEHGPLPDTVEAITGGGGRHLYFAWPDGHDIRNNQSGRLGVGIDVRGNGGFVLAAPSPHPTRECKRCATGAPCPAQPYRWEIEHDPRDGVAVADAPDWLIEALTTPLAPVEPRRPARRRLEGDPMPGDWWAAGTTWPDELTRRGWGLHSRHHDAQGGYYELWTRPGKDVRAGASASLYWQGSDVLKVFSTNAAPLAAEATYTLWGFEVAYAYGGDFDAGARTVRTLMPRPSPAIGMPTGTTSMPIVPRSRPCPRCGSANVKEKS